MKQILSYFFASLVAATTLANLFLLADYAVRYNTYANELCENKDRPELDCDGKCQFAKIMNRHSEPEKPQLNQIVEVAFIAVLSEVEIEIPFRIDGKSGTQQFWHNELLPTGMQPGIPTPPPKLS